MTIPIANSGHLPQPRRPRRTWPQRLLLSVGVISTCMTLAAAGVVAWGQSVFGEIGRVEVPSVASVNRGEPANWLLVGSDSREGIDPNDPNSAVFLGEESSGGKRTDTIMVARVDPKTKTVDLTSLPRDLWVPIAGTGGNERINAAFVNEGGEQRLVQTVEDYLGIEINHYAEINFVGFQKIVDELGGVAIWFDKPMRDAGSGLDVPEAGCVRLDGNQALAFARGRKTQVFENGEWKTDGTGDLGRNSRQQYFIRRVADSVLANVNIANLSTIDSVIRVGGQNLVIDNGASASNLIDLGRTFASVRGDKIRTHTLPVTPFRTSGGAAVLELQIEEAKPILDIYRGLVQPEPVAEENGAIALGDFAVNVLNGSGIDGQAGIAADGLTAAGYQVGDVGNAEGVSETTTVRFPPGSQAAADLVAQAIGGPVAVQEAADATAVELVTGTDFIGINAAATPPPADAPAPQEEPEGEVPQDPPPGVECI